MKGFQELSFTRNTTCVSPTPNSLRTQRSLNGVRGRIESSILFTSLSLSVNRIECEHVLKKTKQNWLPGGSVAKNPPANAMGLIPGLGRPPGEGNATLSSILAWEIPWTEEPGGLHPMGSQKSWTRLSN